MSVKSLQGRRVTIRASGLS